VVLVPPGAADGGDVLEEGLDGGVVLEEAGGVAGAGGEGGPVCRAGRVEEAAVAEEVVAGTEGVVAAVDGAVAAVADADEAGGLRGRGSGACEGLTNAFAPGS
jgi:hypothetical protein